MENSEEKILGGVIDNKLNFKSHINELCERASYINAALSRLSDYLNNSENGLLLSINFLLKNIEYTIKGVLSGLRQFLASESPLKMMKNAFNSP